MGHDFVCPSIPISIRTDAFGEGFFTVHIRFGHVGALLLHFNRRHRVDKAAIINMISLLDEVTNGMAT